MKLEEFTFFPGFLCRLAYQSLDNCICHVLGWNQSCIYLLASLVTQCHGPYLKYLLSYVRIQTLQNGGCPSVPRLRAIDFPSSVKRPWSLPSANPRPPSTSPQPPTLITTATGWVGSNSSPPDLPSISMHHPRITTKKSQSFHAKLSHYVNFGVATIVSL